MEQAATRKDFIGLVRERDYSIKWKDTRKYIVFQDSNRKKIRNSNLVKPFGMPVSKKQLEQFLHDKSQKKEPVHHSRHR